MKKIILVSCLMLWPAVCFAQSMAEYTALTSATEAAAVASAKKISNKVKKTAAAESDQEGPFSKEDRSPLAVRETALGAAMSKIYGSGPAISVTSDELVRGLGSNQSAINPINALGLPAKVSQESITPAAVSAGSETGDKPGLVVAAPMNSVVTVYLRSGKVVSGILVEKNNDSIKVDSAGVTLTYFGEEIEKITQDNKAGSKDQ